MSLADELLAASEDECLADELRALLRRAAERIAEAEMDAEYLELIREMNEAGQQRSVMASIAGLRNASPPA